MRERAVPFRIVLVDIGPPQRIPGVDSRIDQFVVAAHQVHEMRRCDSVLAIVLEGLDESSCAHADRMGGDVAGESVHFPGLLSVVSQAGDNRGETGPEFVWIHQSVEGGGVARLVRCQSCGEGEKPV